MHKVGHEHGHTPENVGYEVTDVQVKVILVAGVGIVILTLFGYLMGTFFLKVFRAAPPISGNYTATATAAEEATKPWNLQTRLQVDPPRALVEFNGEQKSVADSYGVVSEKPEIYRIPVETAMKIVAEKGLPKFPKLPAAAPAEGQAHQ